MSRRALSSGASAFAIMAMMGAGALGAALSLNFTGGGLDPRVTFSRPSLATLIDSAGQISFPQNNLLTYSHDFTNAAWAISGATISTSTENAPAGGGTALRITETATSTQHHFNPSSTAVAGVTYVGSLYVKKGPGATAPDIVQLTFRSAGHGAAPYANFNIATGVVTSQTGGTASISNVGNGWFRISFAAKASATAASNAGAYFCFCNNDPGALRNPSYAGAATSDVYAIGFQYEAATYQTAPREYVKTTASAYYGPRFDYHPVNLTARGVLIEEARTNLLLNASADGTNLATQSVAVTATPYTLSYYGTGSVTLSGAATGVVTGAGAFPARQTYTFTPAAGTLTLTVAGSVQFAQLEAGAFATSYIPTGSSAAARSADVMTLNGVNFTSWYTSGPGSLIVHFDFIAINSANGPGVAAIGDNTLAFGSRNSIYTSIAAGGSYLSASMAVAGVSQIGFAPTANISLNTVAKSAIAWATNDTQLALNGVLGTVDNLCTIPPGANGLSIGNLSYGWSGGGNYLNGHIVALAYYNRRLPDADLQRLTT